MPKAKKNTYECEGKRCKSWGEACGYAADLSLQQGEAVTVVEHGQSGTFHITIRAQAERAN